MNSCSEGAAAASPYATPLSLSITREQLRWLDERRRHGSLSRSAALRQALDELIRAERQGLLRHHHPLPPPALAAEAAAQAAPLLSCQLHQELLAQGEHLTHHCQIGPTALVSANRIQYVKC